MEKVITVAEFADELKSRLKEGKTVDCCQDELLTLADLIKEKIPNEQIKVHWKDQ